MDDKNTDQPTSLPLFVLMWIVLFAIAVFYFDEAIQKRNNPNSDPSTQRVGDRSEVVLHKNRQGHFVVTGTVNQQPVDFIVDTGATDVVLGSKIAAKAGLKQGQGHFAETANGSIIVYETNLNSLSVGGITLRNVRASINPHMDSEFALLGMSFLGQIEFTQKADTLTLRY